MVLTAEGVAEPFSRLFVGYDAELFQMTLDGVRIHALGFLFLGLSIFITAFFTAIGYGTIASVLSAMRSFIFPTVFVFLLPKFFGIAGVWLTGPVTETLGIVIAGALLIACRKLYVPGDAGASRSKG